MSLMADDKTELMWVEEPTIVDGAVSYAYSNIGRATATFVTHATGCGTELSRGWSVS